MSLSLLDRVCSSNSIENRAILTDWPNMKHGFEMTVCPVLKELVPCWFARGCIKIWPMNGPNQRWFIEIKVCWQANYLRAAGWLALFAQWVAHPDLRTVCAQMKDLNREVKWPQTGTCNTWGTLPWLTWLVFVSIITGLMNHPPWCESSHIPGVSLNNFTCLQTVRNHFWNEINEVENLDRPTSAKHCMRLKPNLDEKCI